MTTETRPLETLIKEFDFYSRTDREVMGILGDRPATKGWLDNLSLKEKETFEAYIVQIVEETAKRLGYESATALAKDMGRKLFKGTVVT